MRCMLSRRALGRIDRETGDPSIRKALIAEAWLRKWLALRGVPCWTAPSLPGASHRYSLVTSDGTRILVVPHVTAATMDEAAGARCGITAVVNCIPRTGEGDLPGWLTLAALQRSDAEEHLNPSGELPGFLGVPRLYFAAYIEGSIRLLLAGEPEPPAKGLEGVELYAPRPRSQAGEVHSEH
ncbi:MAG: hypothetical protein R6V62_06620 [Candidatus Fermentibacteraceae bacterium]